jgi:ATP-dependent helicase/nuclease subunit A
VRSPWAHLDDIEISRLASLKKHSLWEATKSHAKSTTIEKLNNLLQMSQKIGIGLAWSNALIEVGMIDWCLANDPSGRFEANIWKLVSQIREFEKSTGFNYLHFIENLERVQLDPDVADGDAVPVIEPKRVNLMTIHASKGLQFDSVIVPRMGNHSFRNESDFLLFDEKAGVCVFAPPDPEESKWSVPLAGQKLKQEKRKREEAEHDRLLYVALTRARTSVTLVYTNQGTRGWSASWAQRMWKPTAVGVSKYDQFTVQLRDQISTVKSKENISAKLAPLILPMKFENPIDERIISVTELLQESAEKNQKSAISLIDATLIAQKGVEAHRIFEALKFDVNLSNDKSLSEAVQFIKGWKSGKLLNVIQSGEVEWGFACKAGEKIIQGQIDLWGRDEEGTVWICDYKTGSEIYKDKAFKQLEIYSFALRVVRPDLSKNKIVLAVIYPHQKSVFELLAPDQMTLQRQLI